MSSISYSNTVSSIIYDRYIACPDKVHSQKLKWILRYLKSTTFSKQVFPNLIGVYCTQQNPCEGLGEGSAILFLLIEENLSQGEDLLFVS